MKSVGKYLLVLLRPGEHIYGLKVAFLCDLHEKGMRIFNYVCRPRLCTPAVCTDLKERCGKNHNNLNVGVCSLVCVEQCVGALYKYVGSVVLGVLPILIGLVCRRVGVVRAECEKHDVGAKLARFGELLGFMVSVFVDSAYRITA